jgi:methylenetetrahydrofolate dehydrogenase (NAD+)
MTAVPASQAPSLGLLLQAAKVAVPFDAELRTTISQLPRPPTLCAILSTSNAGSRAYATFSKTQCENLGITFVLKEIGAGKNRSGEEGEKFAEGEGVEGAIVEANEDSEVDGILVYYPIWGGRQVRDPAGVRSGYTELHNVGSLSPAGRVAFL